MRMRAIVVGHVPHDLQPHRGLAGTLFAKHDRRGRFIGVAVDLVPRRMMRARDTVVFEDRIGLRIFLRERIGANAVMFEKLLGFHVGRLLFEVPRPSRQMLFSFAATVFSGP